jgi:peptide chain release factor 2
LKINLDDSFANKKMSFDKILNEFKILEKEFLYLEEFLILLHELNDADLISNLNEKFSELNVSLLSLERLIFFSDKDDIKNAFIDITAGSGGLDSQDWCGILLKIYINWANKKKFKYEINDVSYGYQNLIKYVSIKITGKYCYGLLKHESGIHRIVRKSPFNNKRHTSFSSVFVYSEVNEKDNFELKFSDLRIDTYKSSGAGGQHVNTTESAVRIKHIPTGIIVQCQSERSQHKNKHNALNQLRSKIKKLSYIKEIEYKNEIEKKKLGITWGNHIRSYIIDKSIVKDLRTNVEIKNIDSVFAGNIDVFIFSMLELEKFGMQ